MSTSLAEAESAAVAPETARPVPDSAQESLPTLKSGRVNAVGATLVLGTIAVSFWTMGPAISGLALLLLVALGLWWTRLAAGTIPVAWLAIGVQAIHFGEEYMTGLQTALPGLFDYSWSSTRFATFNLIWIAVFVAGSVSKQRLARLPLWFLAVASIANGFFHPALAVSAGGYFPGLWTSPLSLAAGLLLFSRLHASARIY